MQHALRDGDGMSPTRRIYWILKLYRAEGRIDDQHWAYLLHCLRRIETRCRECKEEMVIRSL